VPAGALLCALVAYPALRRRASFCWIYGCCLLGYVTTVCSTRARRVPLLEPAKDFPWLAENTVQARDLERFRYFSDDYLALDRHVPQRVIDVRYSMVPNRIDALWGIALDPRTPQAHARFVTDRAATGEERQAVGGMLLRPGLTLAEAARTRPTPSSPRDPVQPQ
jgi:hypothetical protein